MGRHVVTLPVLGLQVQLHRPPCPRKKVDVAIGIEVAVGMSVACVSGNQAPTCHSTSDPLVLVANRTDFRITSVS